MAQDGGERLKEGDYVQVDPTSTIDENNAPSGKSSSSKRKSSDSDESVRKKSRGSTSDDSGIASTTSSPSTTKTPHVSANPLSPNNLMLLQSQNGTPRGQKDDAKAQDVLESTVQFPPAALTIQDNSSTTGLIKLNIQKSILDAGIAESNLKKLRSRYVDKLKGGLSKLVKKRTILDVKTLAGTFTLMSQEQFEKLVHDECSAIVFAARCQLAENKAKCERCPEGRKLVESRGKYTWRCKKTRKCSYKQILKSPLYYHRIRVYTVIQIIYYVSKGRTNNEIISIVGKPSAYRCRYNLMNTVRDVLDYNLKAASSNPSASSESIRRLFTSDSSLDQFGLLLSWLYQTIQQSVDEDETGMCSTINFDNSTTLHDDDDCITIDENDTKSSDSIPSNEAVSNASINILALQSPTQSEITPSAHPDMDRMIPLNEVPCSTINFDNSTTLHDDDDCITIDEHDAKSPDSIPSNEAVSNASINILALQSPTQSEITPSAHPDMDRMIQLIEGPEVQRQRPRRNAAEMGELKIRQIEDTPKSSKLQNSKKLKVKAKTQSLDSKRGAHLICPICEKDLSKLGEIVRAVHCNTCIDKEITRRNLNNANSESNDEDCSDGSVDEDCSDGSVDEDGSDNTEEDVTIENDEKFSGSTTSAKSFMNASINILALQSPTQSEITPSAHPDMDRMIQLIEVHGHCVYGLFLLKEDGSIDHCFYIGESRSPEERLISHRTGSNDNNAKWEYFKNYPRHRIRMIILHRGSGGLCWFLEGLLISNAKYLPIFKLTNLIRRYACVELDCDVVSGLQQLLDLAISKNEGFGADIVEVSATQKKKNAEIRNRIIQAKLDLNHSKTLQNLGLINMVLPSNPPMRDISPEKDLLKLDIHQSIIEIDIAKSNIAKLQSPYVDTFGFQKTQLTDHGTILDAKTLVGTFTSMTQEQFEKLVHDEHSAIAFAARCQLIRNTRKCEKCGRQMKVETIKEKPNRWRCAFTENKVEINCLKGHLAEDSILKQFALKYSDMIRIIYFISKGWTNAEIEMKIEKTKVMHKRNSFMNIIRSKVLDYHLKAASSNPSASSESIRRLFSSDSSLDQFGLLLSWLLTSPQNRSNI